MEVDSSDSEIGGKRTRTEMEAETIEDEEDMTEQLKHTEFPSVTATMLRRSQYMIENFKKDLARADLDDTLRA